MSHKYAKNTERAVECQRLVEELRDFDDEMVSWEKSFVADFDNRLTKFGEGTYVSDAQYEKLTQIYQRIIG